MNELRIWNYESSEIRTVELNGEPWFVGKDVADILEYQNGSRDINRHVDEEDRRKIMLFDGNQNKETIIINESGLYSLVLSSKLPTAKKFKRWVTSEVLPAIRKTGTYQMSQHNIDKAKALEIKEMNARVRMSNQFLKLAEVETSMSKDYKSILVAKAAEVLAGEEILELPKSKQKMYTATEIGEMYGVTAQKVGRVANANNMKIDEYGETYKDKSPYCNKEVDSFRYNDKAVERFKELLKK